MNPRFQLAALGDVSFEGRRSDHPSVECFSDIAAQLHAHDLVVANLESPLTNVGNPIPGKCTLRGCPEWAPVLKAAGIRVVSLANNHVMDYGQEGLISTLEALHRAGIAHAGAGMNRAEACAPLYLDVAGRRVALLGRSAVIVSAPTYADEHAAGVAWLDEEETTAAIRSCRPHADIVVVMLHWGVEEYSRPTPQQRQTAKRLVAAGADAILGHHPHVLQGNETYGNAVVTYSLGNLLFDEFEWMCALPDGAVSKELSPLSEENRKGAIASLSWAGTSSPRTTLIFTRIGADGCVHLDPQVSRAQEMRRLSALMKQSWYRTRWTWYSVRKEWSLRLGGQFSVSRLIANLHRLRPHHLVSALGLLRRSARIVSEKSTNPYE